MRVVLDHITKRFADVTAVSEFSATLEDGELVSLLGPSGCGKSTLLNMLSGILPYPSEAQKPFDMSYLSGFIAKKRDEAGNVTHVLCTTVMGNICFPLETQRVPKAERIERANEIAKLVHVDMLMNRKPSELSGGQQQRVAIARALVKNPRLLLLDEPLSNLDARLRLEMREEIRRIQQRTGVTTIFVTHDQEEALSISDRIVLMKSGVLQQNDLPQRLYNEPANQFVADFLGNPPINNIPGTIQDGRFVTADGKADAALDMCRGVENGRKVNLSVRSESFVLDADGPIACEVTRVYQMGKEEMAYLRMGECDFRAYIDSDEGLKPGDQVHLALKKRGVFLFDRETGERIR